MITIRPRSTSIDPALVERYKAVQPATVGHLLEFGFCDPGVQALWKPCRVVGTAVTVRTSALDSAVVLTSCRRSFVTRIPLAADRTTR